MPTMATVKELAAVWAKARHYVLEIGRGARRCSERRRIQRAASAGEEDEAEEAATDLEAARADVLVWQTIACEMEDRSQQDRGEPRPTRGTGCRTRRDVERNNHGLPSPNTCVTDVSRSCGSVGRQTEAEPTPDKVELVDHVTGVVPFQG
jgi:hypothetical protein